MLWRPCGGAAIRVRPRQCLCVRTSRKGVTGAAPKAVPAIQRTGVYKDNVQGLGERYLVTTLAEGLFERGHASSRASGPGAFYPHRAATAAEESGARANRELRTTLLSQNRGREASVADTFRRADEFLDAFEARHRNGLRYVRHDGPSPEARP